MSIATIHGQKYEADAQQKIYLPIYGLLLSSTGQALKIQRLQIHSFTPMEVSVDVAARIHSLFQLCSYQPSNTAENQTALNQEVRSLFASFDTPSHPLAQRAHTEALTRIPSKPPIGRQRSYEDPTHSRFPLADFSDALRNLNAEKLENIFRKFGWQTEDLEEILDYVKINNDEQRWNQPFEKKTSSPLDEITYRIFLKAIEKKFVPIIPAIPRFSGQTRDFYANEIAAVATEALCSEQTGTHFDFFLSVLKKQQPSLAEEYVGQVLQAAVKKENHSLIEKLQAHFPQWTKKG